MFCFKFAVNVVRPASCCFILHHGWFASVVRSVPVLRSRVLALELSLSTLPPDRHSTDSSDLPLPGSCSFFAFATLRCLFSPGLVSSRYLSLKITGYLLEPLLGQPVSICRMWSLHDWRHFFTVISTMAGICIRFSRLLLMRFCPLRTPHERK